MRKYLGGEKTQSFRARILLYLGVFLVYALIFLYIYQFISRAAIGVTLLPVVIAASVFGRWGGFTAGLFSIPINALLYILVGERDISSFSIENLFVSHISFIIIGFVIGYLRDLREELKKKLSEREQADDALLESEQRFREFANLLPQIVWELDKKGFFTFVNDEGLKIFGYTQDEMDKGVQSLSLLVPEDRARALSHVRKTLAGEEAGPVEYLLRRKDNTTIPVLMYMNPITREGRPVGLRGIHIDITERVRAEQALKESEERYRKIYERVEDVIYETDFTGCLTGISPSIEKQSGYTPDELIGQNVMDFYPYPEEYESLSSEMEAGGSINDFEIRMKKKNGEIAVISVTAHIVFDADGQPVRTEGILRDITERKHTEEKVRQQNKFLSVMHNITLDLLNRRGMDELLQAIVDSAVKLLDVPNVELMLEKGGQLIVQTVTHNLEHIKGEQIERTEAKLTWLAFDTKKPAILDDYSTYSDRRDVYSESELHAVADFPILVRDHCIGVLALGRTQPGYVFSEEQVENGVLFAQLVALVLDSAQLLADANYEIAERKQAEQWLRESEELYHVLFESLPIPVFTKNREGKYISSNAENKKYWAFDPIGKTDAELTDAKTAATLRKIDLRVMKTGEAFSTEERLKNTPLGNRHTFAHKVPLRDSDGNVVGILGASIDITERVKIEKALRKSEAKHQLLYTESLRQAKEMALLHKVRTALANELELPLLFRTVVEAIADTFGYTLVSLYILDEDVLRLQHQVGYHDVIYEVPITKGIMGQVVVSGKSMLLKDVRTNEAFIGAITGIVSEISIPLFDQGVVVGVLNVESSKSITLEEADLQLMTALSEHINVAIERTRLYEEVRKSEERLDTALKGANTGLWDYYISDDRAYKNSTWFTMLGYDPNHPKFKNPSQDELLHPDDKKRVKHLFRKFLSGKEDYYTDEFRLKNKEGDWQWILSSAKMIKRDKDGNPIRVTGTHTDITERKQAEEALEKTQARYLQAEEIANFGFWEWDNIAYKMTSCSPQFAKIYEMTVDEVITFFSSIEAELNIIHPDDRERYEQHRLESDAALVGMDIEYKIILPKSGSIRHIHTISHLVLNDQGEIITTFGTEQDVTDRVQAENALKASEERHRRIIESSSDAIYLTDLMGRCTFVNPVAETLTGYSKEKLLNMHFNDLLPSREWKKRISTLYSQQLEKREPVSYIEFPMLTKSGNKIWVEQTVNLIFDGSEIVGFQGIVRDINQRKKLEQELQHNSTHDPLTDLPNRALFNDRLKNGLNKAKQNKQQLAILFIDLDDFKAVNDAHGHHVGDQLLIAITKRLKNLSRKSDTVARLSGDEFAITIYNISDHKDITKITEKIIARCSKPYKLEKNNVAITLSIGISIYPKDATHASTLLQRADAAMYKAKQGGKNSYRLYNEPETD